MRIPPAYGEHFDCTPQPAEACTELGANQEPRTMDRQRFPRTMQEAFGPYTSNDLHAPDDKAGGGWYAAVVLACFAAIGVMLAWRG